MSEQWWREFFDDEYASFGLQNADPAEIDRIVAFLIEQLDLAAGKVVFDQCCGIGRISLPLARLGLRVIGVDLNESYVERARAAAETERLDCSFHCGDAFEFTAPEPCDAALNWFTSWGYTADDGRNREMLRRAFDSLRPGGRFILDYPGLPRRLIDFQHAIVQRPRSAGGRELLVVVEERLDFERGMMESTWTVIHPDGRRVEREVATRLYLPHTIMDLLRDCGFSALELLGSLEGDRFSRSSARCLIVAQRP